MKTELDGKGCVHLKEKGGTTMVNVVFQIGILNEWCPND